MIEIDKEEAEHRVRLVAAGELTIREAGAFKESLGEALDRFADVELSLERINEVDITGLQLLCAVHKEAQATGKRVVLNGHSSGAFYQALQISGLLRKIGCCGEGSDACLWLKE